MPYQDRAKQLAYMRGWRAQQKRKTTQPSSPLESTPRVAQSERAQLLAEVQAQLGAGSYSSAEYDRAVAAAIPKFRQQRAGRQERSKSDAHSEALARLAQELRPQAYIYLMANSGGFGDADISRVAAKMAENELAGQIPARIMDDGPRLLAPPEGIMGQLRYQPGCEPGQRLPAAITVTNRNVSRLGEPHTQ